MVVYRAVEFTLDNGKSLVRDEYVRMARTSVVQPDEKICKRERICFFCIKIKQEGCGSKVTFEGCLGRQSCRGPATQHRKGRSIVSPREQTWCPGVNRVPLTFICWHPNPQHSRM